MKKVREQLLVVGVILTTILIIQIDYLFISTSSLVVTLLIINLVATAVIWLVFGLTAKPKKVEHKLIKTIITKNLKLTNFKRRYFVDVAEYVNHFDNKDEVDQYYDLREIQYYIDLKEKKDSCFVVLLNDKAIGEIAIFPIEEQCELQDLFHPAYISYFNEALNAVLQKLEDREIKVVKVFITPKHLTYQKYLEAGFKEVVEEEKSYLQKEIIKD